jgi:hypothetical protein
VDRVFPGFPLVFPSGTSFMTARLFVDTNILIYVVNPFSPDFSKRIAAQ